MTEPTINTDVLEAAINEIKDERFQKDMREWLVYGAPPEVVAIWKRYVEKMEEESVKAEARREAIRIEYREMMIWFRLFAWFIFISVVVFSVYQIYEMLTFIPGCSR